MVFMPLATRRSVLPSVLRRYTAMTDTYTHKLAKGTLTDFDRKVIAWQRAHMDVMDVKTGEFRDPTDEDAAHVLDEIRAEAEAMK